MKQTNKPLPLVSLSRVVVQKQNMSGAFVSVAVLHTFKTRGSGSCWSPCISGCSILCCFKIIYTSQSVIVLLVLLCTVSLVFLEKGVVHMALKYLACIPKLSAGDDMGAIGKLSFTLLVLYNFPWFHHEWWTDERLETRFLGLHKSSVHVLIRLLQCNIGLSSWHKYSPVYLSLSVVKFVSVIRWMSASFLESIINGEDYECDPGSERRVR